jgi:biopolymer transport protein ExbD
MAPDTGAYTDEDQQPLIADINVTPLVDIVLVLLIIFMITMPMIATLDALKERDFNLNLAQSGDVLPLVAKPREFVVNIDAGGKYSVMQAALTIEALTEHLNQMAANDTSRMPVIIRADKRCPWQFVAAVMVICNKAKIRDYRVSMTE